MLEKDYKLTSPEFAQWAQAAEAIGKSGRWDAANRLILKLNATSSPWLQVFGSLAAAVFSEYLSLKRAYEDPGLDSAVVAWRARNLLELSIWSLYCAKSKENTLRLFADSGRDVLNLFDAFARWSAIVNKTDVELEPVQREREALAERAALQGVESLEGAYKQVSDAAKELGMGAHFNVANKMLSKFAHPTAMQIMAAAAGDRKTTTVQKQVFFSHGCLFFRGAFDAIEGQLFQAARSSPG